MSKWRNVKCCAMSHRWMNFNIQNSLENWNAYVLQIDVSDSLLGGNAESSLCLYMYWWCMFVLPFRLLPPHSSCHASYTKNDEMPMCVFIVREQWCWYVTYVMPASMYWRCEQRINERVAGRRWRRKRETASEMEKIGWDSDRARGMNLSSEDNANTYFVNRYF